MSIYKEIINKYFNLKWKITNNAIKKKNKKIKNQIMMMIGLPMKKIKVLNTNQMSMKILMEKIIKIKAKNKNSGADIIFVNVKKDVQNV